jgi:hypothetical protein
VVFVFCEVSLGLVCGLFDIVKVIRIDYIPKSFFIFFLKFPKKPQNKGEKHPKKGGKHGNQPIPCYWEAKRGLETRLAPLFSALKSKNNTYTPPEP